MLHLYVLHSIHVEDWLKAYEGQKNVIFNKISKIIL